MVFIDSRVKDGEGGIFPETPLSLSLRLRTEIGTSECETNVLSIFTTDDPL